MTDKMPELPPEGATWRKSSFSDKTDSGGECVEVALVPEAGTAWVRDSKDPEGGAFRLPASGWRGFLAVVQRDAQQ